MGGKGGGGGSCVCGGGGGGGSSGRSGSGGGGGSGSTIVRKVEHLELFKNERVQERISRTTYEDKRCGNYSRLTTKEKVSSSEFVYKHGGRVCHKEEKKVASTIKFGPVCHKEEKKVTSTIKVGNKYKSHAGEFCFQLEVKRQSVNFKNKSIKY